MTKKTFLIILGILVILIVAIFAIGYFASKNQEKEIIPVPIKLKQAKSEEMKSLVPPSSKTEKIKVPALSVISEEEISEICKEYKNLEIPVSCEEAIMIVLDRFEDNVEKIYTIKPFPQGRDSENIWLIGANFKEAINNIDSAEFFITKDKILKIIAK